MITLLIPTLNRSDFVIRYLRYLRDTGFSGRVCIGDSSTGSHLERTQQAIKQLGADYEVVHREYPDLKHFECIRAMLPLVTTPYVMFICDDDLLVPGTLDECMRFLDANPDYSAATGAATIFQVHPDGAFGEIVSAGEYRLQGLEADAAAERLFALLSDYTVIAYSVARTEQFKARWTARPGFSEEALAVELFPGSMLAIQGKVKRFDRLFVARQDHKQRYLSPDLLDRITAPAWADSYAIFRQLLVEELTREGMDQAAAALVVKRAFWAYLMAGLGSKWRSFNAAANGVREVREGRARQVARRIPGVRSVLRRLRAARAHPLSLAALLRPGSRYYDDFRPVHQAVTAERPGRFRISP